MNDNKYSVFVILSEPRTGSNMLTSKFSSVPDVVCHAEIFHPDAIYIKLPKDTIPNIGERDSNPESFITKILDKTYEYHQHPNIIGFKIFFDHNPAAMSYVYRNNIPVILLERKNKVAQYSSLKIAKNTDQWTSVQQAKNKVAGSSRKVRFSLIEYIAFTLRSRARFIFAMHKLKKESIPFIHVYYEGLVKGTGADQISSFIGADIASIEADVGYQKQNPGELSSRFKNPRYFAFWCRLLASTPIIGRLLSMQRVMLDNRKVSNT